MSEIRESNLGKDINLKLILAANCSDASVESFMGLNPRNISLGIRGMHHQPGALSNIYTDKIDPSLETTDDKPTIKSVSAEYLTWFMTTQNIPASEYQRLLSNTIPGFSQDSAENVKSLTDQRVQEMTCGFAEFIDNYNPDNPDQQKLLWFYRAALRAHKALVTILLQPEMAANPFQDTFIPPGLYGWNLDEMEKDPRYVPYAESIREFYTVYYQAKLTGDAKKIWQAKQPLDTIQEFYNAQDKLLESGGETGDLTEQVRALQSHIDYMIASGRLPDTSEQKEIVVVDMGIGRGRLAGARMDYLRSKGYSPRLIGIDLSREALDVVAKKGIADSSDLYQCSYESACRVLPPDIKADLVVCDWGSIHHMLFPFDLEASLLSMVEIMKDSGSLALDLANSTTGDLRGDVQQYIYVNFDRDYFDEPLGVIDFTFNGQSSKVGVYPPSYYQYLLKSAGATVDNVYKYKITERSRQNVWASKTDWPQQTHGNLIAYLICQSRFRADDKLSNR